MSTQETRLPKFSHEDRIRMHFQRKQIRTEAKAYIKERVFRLVPFAFLFLLAPLLESVIGLFVVQPVFIYVISILLDMLLFPISVIGVANVMMKVWNENRVVWSDLLIAVRSPKRFINAIFIISASSVLNWFLNLFSGEWVMYPRLLADLFAVFFAFVPFLYSRNPDARAIDLIKDSFRKVYRFFWQWIAMVLQAGKGIWITLLVGALVISAVVFNMSVQSLPSVNTGLFVIAMEIPIALFFLPYYLLATTGFVNDQVLTASQPKPEEITASPV